MHPAVGQAGGGVWGKTGFAALMGRRDRYAHRPLPELLPLGIGTRRTDGLVLLDNLRITIGGRLGGPLGQRGACRERPAVGPPRLGLPRPRARLATLRTQLIEVPARLARSGRRLTLHLTA